MAYIKRATPGWRPNFRGLGEYIPKATPGWRPNFRGLGYVEKLVVSGLGCACKKNITLGQDENFGVPTSLVDFSAPTFQYPTSNASAYTPSGPEPYLPTSGTSSYWGAPGSPATSAIPVLNNPQISPLSAGGMLQTGAPNSESDLLLWVGGAVLAVVVLAGAGGRRR